MGVMLTAFSVPSLLNAYADRRLPKQAALMLIVAGVAMAYAIQENPDTYTLATIDETIVNVLGRYFN